MDVIIKIDNNEQQPWKFLVEDKKRSGYITRVVDVQTCSLDTADVTLSGFENQLFIERKKSFSELMGNMSPVTNRERFERELERMGKAKHKYIVVESNLSNEILGLSIGQQYKGPPMSRVVKWLLELQNRYGVNVIFAGDAGQKVCRYIIDAFIRDINV